MVELCNYFSRPIARIDGEDITDPYGRFLYIIKGDTIYRWSSREVLYYIKGDTITNFYGRMLYTFDGSSFKEFSGFITFQYNNGRIRRFGSIDEYVIKGDPTKTEIAALILLFIAPK